MRTLVITESTRTLLEAHAVNGKLTGAKKVKGGYEVQVDDDVAKILSFISDFPDEAIRKACTNQFGRA